MPEKGFVSVAILAGGASRRMGEDKALLELADAGPTLLGMVIDRVSELTGDLFLVAPRRPGYAAFGIPIYPDRFGTIGPIGGVATALTVSRHERCLVVSCDTPFLSPRFLEWMVAHGDATVTIPALFENDRSILQPLHAIYRRECLSVLMHDIESGERRLSRAIERLDPEIVPESTIRELDPSLRGFFSVNTPDALATARDWYASRHEILTEQA
jgi:molybdopterin-guanine dinucleotide biosynthesis protein A